MLQRFNGKKLSTNWALFLLHAIGGVWSISVGTLIDYKTAYVVHDETPEMLQFSVCHYLLMHAW